MLIRNMLYKQFYSELGKLLYAIADSNGEISKQERDKLLEIVQDELQPAEEHTDVYKTNLAWYAQIEFEFLEEQIADPEAAMESFLDFVEDHFTGFDERMKKASLRVAKEIADAYHGTNKKEAEMLKRIKNQFSVLEKKHAKK
jgi:uncharacterized tellurite resistance protein B-like protein